MPGAVGAAGAALGGYAGGKLKEAMGGGGTGGNEAPIVDPTESLWYDFMGLSAASFYIGTGEQLYSYALKQSRQDIKNNYAQSIAELRPAAEAGRRAMDEMMRFMGIDPVPATNSIGQKLSAMGDFGALTKAQRNMYQFNIGENQTYASSVLNDLLAKANNEKDPAMRAQYKTQVNNAFDVLVDSIKTSNKAEIASQVQRLPKPVFALDGATQVPQISTPDPKTGKLTKGTDWAAYNRLADFGHAIYDEEARIRQREIKNIKADRNTILNEVLTQTQDLQAEFNNSYTPEYDAAYTGDQIVGKVKELPGYQAKLDYGTQAIERQGAAKGMLGSGNTLLELQKYGQDLGMDFYQQNLQNLSGVVSTGMNATAQIASLYQGQGQTLAEYQKNKGEGQMAAYNKIAEGYLGTLSSMSDTAFQANAMNAQMLNSNIQKQKDRDAAQKRQQTASAPGMASAQQSAGSAAGFGSGFSI